MTATSDPSFDHSLYTHFSSLEADLINATQGSNKDVKSFLQRLTGIQKIAKRAFAEKSLTKKTASLIRSVALTGSAIAKFASRVANAEADIEKKQQERLEEAMAKLTLDDEPEVQTHSEKRITTLEQTTMGDSPPVNAHGLSLPASHVKSSFTYLLENIHEPFLTYDARKRIAQQAGVSEKVISDWFINIRQKIGWSAIQKKYFNKNRSLAIDCARTIFLGEPSKIPVSADIISEFKQMKSTAELLYKEKCELSINPKELDALVAERAIKSTTNDTKKKDSLVKSEPTVTLKSRPRTKREREECSEDTVKTSYKRGRKRHCNEQSRLKGASSTILSSDLVPASSVAPRSTEEPQVAQSVIGSKKRRRDSEDEEVNLKERSLLSTDVTTDADLSISQKLPEIPEKKERCRQTKRICIRSGQNLPVASSLGKPPEASELRQPWMNISFDIPEMVSINGQIPGELEFAAPDRFDDYNLDMIYKTDLLFANPYFLPSMPIFGSLLGEASVPTNPFCPPPGLCDTTSSFPSARIPSPDDTYSLASTDTDYPPETPSESLYLPSQSPAISDLTSDCVNSKCFLLTLNNVEQSEKISLDHLSSF